MPIRFTFRDSPVVIKNFKDADPQKIGEELTRIGAKAEGRLIPDDVVAAAQASRNPLHKHFEWSDKVCGQLHRIEQARELIRCIRVITDDADDKPPQRAWLNVRDNDGHSYRSLDEVMTSHSLQLAVLQQAERDLKAWEARYSEIVEICDLVRVARERLAEKIGRIKGDEAHPH